MAPPDDVAEAVADPALSIWRVRWIVAVAFTAVALVATADAERSRAPTDAALRAQLGAQLTAESEAIGKALAIDTAKLAEIDALRTRHVAAAYRLVRDERVDDTDRMTVARRRAVARLLLQHDRAERELLATEISHLKDAAARVARDQAAIAQIAMPPRLLRPAHGAIARRFGTWIHDRSKATLTRRGIDLDVEAHVDAEAPADGVVRYAGPIRGLDNGVILDHGGYLTVIAKLGELEVNVGARLSRGDRLGRAARQRIYLELRVEVGPGGLPIDPEPLLESESRSRH